MNAEIVKYGVKPFAKIPVNEVEAYHTELLSIFNASRGRGFSIRMVTERAAKPESPLHGHPDYLWDRDALCVTRYRDGVSASIVRDVVIVTRDREGEEVRQRAFLPVETTIRSRGGEEYTVSGYAPLTHILERQDWKEQVRARFFRELGHFAERYRHFQEAAPEVDELETLVAGGNAV